MQFEYDRKNEQLRIEHIQTGKGMTISISGVVANWHEQKDKAIDEIVYYVEEGLQAMESDAELSGKEKKSILLFAQLHFHLKPRKKFHLSLMSILQKQESIMLLTLEIRIVLLMNNCLRKNNGMKM